MRLLADMKRLFVRERNPKGSMPFDRDVLHQFIRSAQQDPAFSELRTLFSSLDIEHWLYEDEMALHFGVGAFAPSGGRIVEIGSWQGASAIFLAGGIARRGTGKLTCIDPFLGAPPWLGQHPDFVTYPKFIRYTKETGVAPWIEVRTGESGAIASVWEAEPIDAVFIDADHSFLGALRDFECWTPKVKPGGLIMFDDADDPALPELLDLIEALKSLTTVRFVELVHGVAVFTRGAGTAQRFFAELSHLLGDRGIRRPWDLSYLHDRAVPQGYMASARWTDQALTTAYYLCYFARCESGSYGYTPSTVVEDRQFLEALGRDRSDGDVRLIDARHRFRSILCTPGEAATCAPLLLTGGVLIVRTEDSELRAAPIRVKEEMLGAGLDGIGWAGGTFWGVRLPHRLSPEAVVEFTSGLFP
jgi:predicted O-methyltransferase YrrM